ncbi:MAG: WD40/YVTN/BNR-like repeat-containing protein [Fimbriimonadaceae bacterium]
MAFFPALMAIGLGLVQQDPMGVKQLPPKTNELSQFHKPDVKGMPVAVRLDAFEKRNAMLKDSIFQQIKWRNVGPEVQGGRVVDIDVAMKAGKKVFVAFATGGLWTTENLGQSWTPIFDDQSSYGIGDIAVTPDGKTIWVGTGEANSQRTSYAGTGVFVSRDGGETWKNMGLTESQHIGQVEIDPKDPNTVYVAALGPLYSQGGQRGLYKTTDGGKSWNLVLKGDDRTGCMDVKIDPRGNGVIYAAMWERDRRAWNILESGPGSAVWKSADNGKTWTKMAGLPNGMDMGRTALAVAPSQPDTVYAFIDGQGGDRETGDADEYQAGGTLTFSRFRKMTDAAVKGLDEKELSRFLRPLIPQDSKPDDVAKKVVSGEMSRSELSDLMKKRNPAVFDADPEQAQIYRSDNAGKTWVKTRPRIGDHGGYYWNEAIVSPFDQNEVYTLGLLILKSKNAGGSWEAIGRRNHVDHHALWIDPTDGKFMLNGNDGGIYASFDSGNSWTHWNNLPVGQLTTIGVDNKPTYNIFGGLQDNGTMKGPNTYRPGISDINLWNDIGGGDGSAIAVDPRGDGDIVYGASQFGSFYFFDQANNQRRFVQPTGIKDNPALRFNWIAPILISKFQPDIIYAGSQRLHRSFDQGRTWEVISGDLTKDMPNGDVPYSSLTTLSESPFRFGQIYVGADDGSVKYTPDTGLTWKDIATPAQDRWVTRIVASSHKNGRVYCTQNGYRQDEWTPYVWVSEDFGANWKSIAANLPFEPVNTIREDSTNPDILYVGTDMGVYVSMDRGGSWIAYGAGIPNTPVHDLVIQDKAEDMVIASHARSAWVVSVKPIRKLTKEIMAEEFHSFAMDVPSGRDRWPYRRSPEYADDTYQDQLVTSEIWSSIAGVGGISLVDKDGKVVVSRKVNVIRGLNLLSLGLMLQPGDPTAPPVKGDPNDPKTALNDPYAARRAQYVEKGTYQLVLMVGGKEFKQEVGVR